MRLLDALMTPGPVEARFTVDDYAQMLKFNGHQYVIGPEGSKPDQVSSDFVSYVRGIHNKHGVVAAAVAARALLVSQIRFKWRRPDGTLFGTPALSPLERPGSTTRPSLLSQLEHDASYGGTGFVVRRRGRLFRLQPGNTRFVLGSDSDPSWDGDTMIPPYDTQVVGLVYDPGKDYSGKPGRVEAFAPGEFAVWAPEPDPIYWWRGQSWVTSVVREILLDGQVTDYEGKFFENATVASLVFLMEKTKTPTEVQAYAEAMNAAHQGVGNAHKNLFIGAAEDVKVVGSKLSDLGLSDLQGTYENRVAVRSRIPASVLGTKESLSGSSLNAGNYTAARRVLADGWFTPTVDGLCAALEAVVPPPNDGSELAHDPSRILFLQEDEKDASEIRQADAGTVRQLIDAGFEPDSAVQAVKTNDMSKLVHTGLVSVQLQPPGSGMTEGGNE